MKFPPATRSTVFVLIISVFLVLITNSLAHAQTPAKKKIVILGLPDSAITDLKKSAPANVQIVAPSLNQVPAEMTDADALITPALTRDMVRGVTQLKWLQILNAGVEDIAPAFKNTDITLTNLKVVLGPEVADHAMALLLSLTRGLYQTIPARKWEQPRSMAQLTELNGKTAVVVGVGGVGTQIAQRANAFGMTIIGVDPKDTPAPSFIKQMVKPSEMDTVLPQADVVFVTVPETPATKGMIGASQFREMKQGAYFIVVSRGAVYSMDALVEAMSSRHLAGAGLDVANPEPLPANHPIWKFENVVITPHIAGASDASMSRVIELLKENIRRFGAGEPPLNVVDKEKGY
ncbi:MAG TPA: D-2-hydroxyacid dehydrogenase [Candidatus Acidoferrales bacterium]|nr:D-2-hydroxyacid dehydrogenase [Candidatus Acidoferrales bacterium]